MGVFASVGLFRSEEEDCRGNGTREFKWWGRNLQPSKQIKAAGEKGMLPLVVKNETSRLNQSTKESKFVSSKDESFNK